MERENFRTSDNVPDMLTTDRVIALEKKRGSRNCETCYFSIEIRNPQNPLQWVRICKWGPPGIAAVGTQQGLGIIPLDRVCPPGHWCFQWRLTAVDAV